MDTKNDKSTKSIVRVLVLLIFMFSFIYYIGVNKVEAAKKTKEYPSRDKDLSTYQTVKSLPDEIYNTLASENGLKGNCYCIAGKVKGVYKGLSKLCKAMKIKYDSSGKDPMMENIKYILVKTDNGYIVIYDLYSYIVNNVLEEYNSGKYSDDVANSILDSYIEKYVYYEPYDEFPQKGEKVKIYATYSGFSDVTKTPMFYYGINQLMVDGTKDEKTVDLNPETKTFKYDNIKLEIPKNWIWYTSNDVYKSPLYSKIVTRILHFFPSEVPLNCKI